MKILYEMTYATRGQSGIPRDAKRLAQILLDAEELETDFLLNPRGYTRRKKATAENLKWTANELGDALRRDPGRSPIPSVFISALTLIQSFSLIRKIPTLKIDSKQAENTFNYLGLEGKLFLEGKSSVSLLMISHLSRFARPGNLKPFSLNTSDYPVFIQQQADPIAVNKETIHIVRLHDFLPISHPQFFDQNGVKVFSKSLRIMLKGNRKIWVMDSVDTAQKFKLLFGKNLDVRVIPCVVPVKKSQDFENVVRKNQICIVNTIEPRKRVGLAISGFREGKSNGAIPDDWQLIIIGNEGWQEKSLAENLRKQVFGSDVIFKESAPDFELDKVYQESKIVLSTSAAEGFGLPPLEGMAYGCLPVVSRIPQHEETVTNLGVYFDGNGPENVANALGEAIRILSNNDISIVRNLADHVEQKFSAEVIGKQWTQLLKEVNS